MSGNRRRFWRTGRGLLLVAALLLTAGTVQAKWLTLLYETFERPVETWPWGPDVNGRRWRVAPTNQRHWSVEQNTVYHPSVPTYVNSLWCAGWPNDRLPGTDPYPPNFATIAYWGPFSLEDAVAATGNLYLMADMETNAGGTGDDFMILTTDDIQSNEWYLLYQFGTSSTNGLWNPIPFDFDSVYTADFGDTLSYLGDSLDVYFGLYFFADADNQVGLGAFVDDIAMGYDDGQYDFERRTTTITHPDDPDLEYTNMYVGLPVRVHERFAAHGNFLSNEVTHRVLVDGEVLDTTRAQWQGSRYGEIYEMGFNTTYTPTDTGWVEIVVQLDAYDEQPEWSEANNADTIRVHVGPENTPPSITFFRPADEDTVIVDGSGEFTPIIYEAYNLPENEMAFISFFYDDDTDPSTAQPIMGSLGLTLHDGVRDTVNLRVNTLEDGDYHILAVMDDYFFPTRSIYADGIVRVDHTDVEENPGELPREFAITSTYPNPFNPTVDVAFQLPAAGEITATWFSVDGRQVDQQKFGTMAAGNHRVSWTPNNLPSGLYILSLQAPMGTLRQKVTYIK